MSEIAARTRELVVEADGARLLGPVNLELLQGEHVLVVGPSGCGKTTLLRSLAGLTAPTSGTIELFGQAASSAGSITLAPEKRRIGYLFQGAALWPHMSAAKTLRFVLAQRGIKGKRAGVRASELLDQVHLGGFEKRTPGTLSGGEKQRLALARAMAVEPRLVLLDEPLGPLDAEMRSELLDLIADLHRKESWTTVHVTHDPEEASRIAGRVLRMEQGVFKEQA